MVLLSIIIPVYNRQKSLVRLVSSLRSSSGYEKYEEYIEIIVVDDFSIGEVIIPKIVKATLIRNASNLGAPYSRRKGYEVSKGAFVHFHDSDDSFPKEWLASVINAIRNNDFDVMVTARNNTKKSSTTYKYQKYFHKNCLGVKRIKKRLVYRNCMGPLGGVVFSKSALSSKTFKSMASSQDWYMYIQTLSHATRLISRPDITYNFYVDGDDRISHNSHKKILGFLQLSRTTSQLSFFGRKIRLYYLYTCRQHIENEGGLIKKFYKKNKISIIFYYIIITLYWRFS